MRFHHLIPGILLLNLLFNSVFAQSPRTPHDPVKLNFYYNLKWELTTPEKSAYRREAYFDLTDMVFDGVFSDYTKDNKLIADGSYYHGVKSGIHSEYNSDFTIKSKVEYSDDDFTFWEWTDAENGEVKNGTGKFKLRYYYFVELDAQLTWKQGWLSGEFQFGKRVGRWIYTDMQNAKTDEETYERGKFVNRVHYTKGDSIKTSLRKPVYLSLIPLNTEALICDKDSFTNLTQYFEKYITYPADFQRNITYPGGIKRLLTLITQMIYIQDRYLCVIGFRFDEHGQVTKTSIERSIDRATDDRVLEAFQLHAKRLLPAIMNGKPFPTVNFLPVSGGKEWLKLLEEKPSSWFLDYSNFSN
ncbi:hypothetical protein WSM22_12470 [Cytophagales bacterium WSM2-2]|nr:hypothetical protein WSM22_12470 [Cytophagales bacterium WSM2-2]